MTHEELVRRAVRWLRNTRGCGVVFAELVTSAQSIPDAIGWKAGGSMLVECKASRSDFFADKRKAYHRTKQYGMGDERYYMVPSGLVSANELPAGWGLLYAHPKTVRVVVSAPWNHDRDLLEEVRILTSAARRWILNVPFDPAHGRFQTLTENAGQASRPESPEA